MRFALLIIFMAIVIGACGSDPSTPLSQQTLGEYMEDNIDISARVETVDGMTQIFADIGVDACGVGVCYFDTELLCSSYCARDCADTCEVRYLQDNRGRNCAEDADEVNAARAHCAGTGPDNGGGTNCRDDPDICLGDRPICRYDNRCVECLGDSDCGGHKPHCSAGGECRECIFPGDCNRKGDTCDIWTGTCVPEQSDDDNDNDGNQGSSDNGDSDNGACSGWCCDGTVTRGTCGDATEVRRILGRDYDCEIRIDKCEGDSDDAGSENRVLCWARCTEVGDPPEPEPCQVRRCGFDVVATCTTEEVPRPASGLCPDDDCRYATDCPQ